MKKILWVLPKNTFPINDGAKKANYSLLKSVCKLNSNVDILVFNDCNDNEQDYRESITFNNIYFIKRKKYTSKLQKFFTLFIQFVKYPHVPITASYFQESDVVIQIDKILKNEYDSIVFDGLHPFIGFENFKLPKVIYRAHNVESELWFTKMKSSSNFFYKILLKWQGHKIESLEERLLKRAKVTWTIAEEDKLHFKNIINLDKIQNILVGLDFSPKKEKKIIESNVFMFLGKLDWEPNKDGLIWFLKDVWPKVDHNKSILKIAGSGNSTALRPYLNQKGIEFLGFIDNVDDLYNEADCSIVPIQYGSGTRIKVIESVSKYMPMISTPMGVQGSGLKTTEYYNAESLLDWIKFINEFNSENAKHMANMAAENLKSQYDSVEIAKKALATINN